MYEGEKLEAALLNYTVDALFELYRNLLQFQNKMRIQATIGVTPDDNKQNTHVVTFNIERSKDISGLVKCVFEEERDTASSWALCVDGKTGSQNTPEVQTDEEDCETSDMPPSQSIVTAMNHRERLPKQDDSFGNKNAGGVMANQLQDLNDSDHNEPKAMETDDRYGHTKSTVTVLDKKKASTLSPGKPLYLSSGAGKASNYIPEDQNNSVQDSSWKTKQPDIGTGEVNVSEDPVARDTYSNDQNPSTSDVVREQTHYMVGYSDNAEAENSDYDLMVSPFEQRKNTSVNSTGQSKAVSCSEYSGSFDIEKLLHDNKLESKPSELELRGSPLEDDNVNSVNEDKEGAIYITDEDDDGHALLDQIEKVLDDESHASGTRWTTNNKTDREYEPTDADIATSSGFSQAYGFGSLIDSASDFEEARPSLTQSSSRNKSEKKRRSVDCAEPSTSTGYTGQSPKRKLAKVGNATGDINRNETSASNQNGGSLHSSLLKVSPNIKRQLQERSADLISQNKNTSKPEKDGSTRKRRKPCGECPGCEVKEDCGKCRSCENKNLKQKCQQRKCHKLKQNSGKASKPSDPKQRKLALTPRKTGSVKIVMTTCSSDEENNPK